MQMARKIANKPKKIGLSRAIAVHRRCASGSDYSRFGKEGYDRASTNRIAEVAGVSIGSLYQYFPSKEALVAAVIERHTQEISQVMRNALVKAAARPIEAAAREFVSVAIDGSPRQSQAAWRPCGTGPAYWAARKYRG